MKYPWMPLFWGDILSKTLDLSAAEFGAYVLLICHAWNHEAMVPLDSAQRIARIDNRHWRRVGNKVLSYFERRVTDAGRPMLWHGRVALELALAAEKTNKYRDGALLMHEKRRARHDAGHPQSPSQSQKKEAPRAPNGAAPTQPNGAVNFRDKGPDHRAPPRKKSDNVLQPLPDRSDQQTTRARERPS